jgi:tetratricopeptide (TPR) repeat protein
MIKITIKISLVCSILLLSACGRVNDSIGSICKNSPELCDDLHKIGNCRYKRTDVIRARYYDKIEPVEMNRRKLLTELDQYESCLELTLYMQFTRNKQRKKLRVENYLRTQELIQLHLLESKGTQDPMLAYYLWTHYQDLQARDVFLAAATKDNMSDPRLLFKLAILYVKNNPQEALKQFYKALRLSQSIEKISPSTFTIIMNIYYQNKQFEEAYIWALIAKKEDKWDEFPINLELILKKGGRSGDNLVTNEIKLKDKAERYHEALENGVFKENPLMLK